MIDSQRKFDNLLHKFPTRDAVNFVAGKRRVHPLMHGGNTFLARTGNTCALFPCSTNVNTAEISR